jgi:hypothetical protein
MSVFLFSGIPILFFWISYLIRYGDAREYYLRAICAKYMTKCVYVNNIDMELITQVLTSTEKGDFIERRIATPAWLPIISLESCDGEQWIRTKRNFMTFMNIVSFKNIDVIVTNYCEKTEFLDSEQISKIAVSSFCNKIFEYNLSETELDILYKASLEWRKDIAMKGYGDMQIKMKAVSLILNIIKQHNVVYSIFGEKWNEPEYYSVIMQPCIISQMINIPDIMTNAHILHAQGHELLTTDDFITRIVYAYHPFPVLERMYNGTQYFIPLDKISNFENYHKTTRLLAFGSGPRKCPGSQIAIEMIRSFIIHYNNNPCKCDPTRNHLFSGRNNDKFVVRESLYTLVRLIYVFFTR